MNTEILEKLNNSISKIINEELSISLEIVNASKDLTNFIISDLKNAEIHKNGLISYKEHSFNYFIFGNTISIMYKVYTSGINLIKYELYGKTDYTPNSTSLILNLALYNGQPIETYFSDIIYHELTHLYQYIFSKKDTLLNKNDNKLYQNIKNVLSNNYNDDIQTFANALYMTFNFEQDAMLHGLYGKIISQPYQHIENIIENSSEKEYIYDLVWSIENINIFPENLFEITKNAAKNRYKKAYIRYLKKIGKLYIKAKNDSKTLFENDMIPNIQK